jgi:hypothetical protein
MMLTRAFEQRLSTKDFRTKALAFGYTAERAMKKASTMTVGAS